MNRFKRVSITLCLTFLLSGVAMTVPASARNGTSDNSSTSSGGNSHELQNSVSRAVPENESEPNDNQNEAEVENHASDLRDQFKSLAQQDLAQRKAQAKQHTEAEREQFCDNRKDEITNRMNNAVKDAQAHKAVFDKIYSKVKTFYDSKGLNVTNYDALIAAADKAQSDAAASISALQGLNVSVDCTSQTVVNNISSFQQAVKATRDSLKTYRSTITDLITALKGASTSANTNSSNQ
jgi:hypothetical protein